MRYGNASLASRLVANWQVARFVKTGVKVWQAGVIACALVWLGSCASSPNARELITDAPEAIPDLGAARPAPESDESARSRTSRYPSEASRVPRLSQVYPGTGTFIKETPAKRTYADLNEKQDVELNFESAEVREVVAMILGEVLRENYVVDPNVKGNVTLRTSRPLDRGALLAILEVVLQVNGAALVHRDGLYKVVPMARALQGVDTPGLGTRRGRPGYQVRLIPLQYIAAEEMNKILEPFIAKEGVLRVDPSRNLLIVAGSADELAQIGDMVGLFDVDWLQGMSFAFLPIRYTDPQTIAGEIEALFAEQEDGPLGNLVRLVPVQRLNALMVISSQPRYLREVQKWIARLDVPGEGEGRRLYVFRVQNGRAEDLAGILRELFGLEGERPARAEQATELAPGSTPRLVELRPGDEQSAGAESPATGVIQRRPEPPPAAPPVPQAQAPLAEDVEPRETSGAGAVGRVNIVADRSRNALLILATPNDYAKLEAALIELDVPPLQVLLEATVVQVNLSGELSHGMQWFFDHRLPATTLTDDRVDFIGRGVVGLPVGIPGTLSYSIIDAAQEVRLLLNVLATEDKLKVVASPSVLVLDNESASIRVGDQQPISTTVVTEGGVVASSVQFKDTGVTLQVTPRVNAGGLVTLDINQELTNTGAIDDATGQRAFLQRSIQSRVALHSGESVVLGGLISEDSTRSESGVPFLHKIPVIGFFFGQKVNTVTRNELVVVLNATVVENRDDTRELAREFRRKMRNIFPPPTSNTERPSSAPALPPDSSATPPREPPLPPPRDAVKQSVEPALGLEPGPISSHRARPAALAQPVEPLPSATPIAALQPEPAYPANAELVAPRVATTASRQPVRKPAPAPRSLGEPPAPLPDGSAAPSRELTIPPAPRDAVKRSVEPATGLEPGPISSHRARPAALARPVDPPPGATPIASLQPDQVMHTDYANPGPVGAATTASRQSVRKPTRAAQKVREPRAPVSSQRKHGAGRPQQAAGRQPAVPAPARGWRYASKRAPRAAADVAQRTPAQARP